MGEGGGNKKITQFLMTPVGTNNTRNEIWKGAKNARQTLTIYQQTDWNTIDDGSNASFCLQRRKTRNASPVSLFSSALIMPASWW